MVEQNQVFSNIPAATVPPVPKEQIGFFWKLRNIFFHPNRFFEGIKSESARNTIIFYTTIALINFSIIQLVNMFVMKANSNYSIIVFSIFNLPPNAVLLDFSALYILFMLGTSFATILLSVIIFHFFILIFSQSKGFDKTFKALLYSYFPTIFLMLGLPMIFFDFGSIAFFPIALVLIISVWRLFLLIKGLARLHEISTGMALGITLMPVLIAIILLWFLMSPLFFGILLGGFFIMWLFKIRR